MKILSFEVKNFGSFRDFKFILNNKGLIHLAGDTGAGKSTFNDIIPWILYGVTAKNGKVDDVRTWNCSELTTGSLALRLNSGDQINIYRSRGLSNDLFWQENLDTTQFRGTNLTETQQLLEHRLGITKDFYLFCTMFNEFSVTRNFFMGDVDTRRKLFNQIANLDFSKNLLERVKNEKKEGKKNLESSRTRIHGLTTSEAQLTANIIDATARSSTFEQDQHRQLQEINEKSRSFEQNRTENLNRYQALSDDFEKKAMEKVMSLKFSIKELKEKITKVASKCDHCGQPNKKYREIEKELVRNEHDLDMFAVNNPYITKIYSEKSKPNPFNEVKLHLMEADNPFVIQIEEYKKQLELIKSKKLDADKEIIQLKHRVDNLLMLETLLLQFNKLMLVRSTKQIQDITNKNLTDYFYSEIQVEFDLVGVSDLDVKVRKNGNQCSYSQLSRGQRSMLNLCFSIGVMVLASRKTGIKFNLLSFDEVLDGLSPELKRNAVSLFQSLNVDYESIFVVDHATEIENMFDSTINFTLVNNQSIIKEV